MMIHGVEEQRPNRRPRVLVLAERMALPEGQIPPHGSGAHVAATLAGLQAHFDVLPLLGEEEPLDAGSPVRRARWIPGRLRGLRRDLFVLAADSRYARQALGVARGFRPDVVYERDEYLSLAGARVSRGLGIPLVLEANGLPDVDVRTIYRSFAEPLGRRIQRSKLRKADAVVTVSPGLARLLVELGVEAERIAVVPNSVPADRVRREPRPVRHDRAVIAWIGHVMRWHFEALEFLLAAAPAVVERAPQVRFEVIGSGPGLDDLGRRVQGVGLGDRFRFAGPVAFERVPEVLEEVDIGVIPTVFEYAFPVKLVELGAAGIPVVAPRSASLDEQLEPFLEYEPFAPGDRAALADALVRLALDPERRAALGEALRAAVRDRFTWDATGRLLSEAVSRALERASAPRRRP